MKFRLLIILSVACLLLPPAARGQYRLPVGFAGSDSLSLSEDLQAFAGQIGVHFGSVPGTVFPQNREYPRIQFYYQQDAAFTLPGGRYWADKKDPITSTGVFTGMGDITGNLQVFLRYNAMVIDGKTAVLNGFGARYRTGVGTDSLHSVSVGFLTQQLAGGQIMRVNDLDFTLQYARYFIRWTARVDLSLSYVSGNMDLSRYPNLGEQESGEFNKRVGHLGIGITRTWGQFNTGAMLQTTGRIWNLFIEIGWELPSSY